MCSKSARVSEELFYRSICCVMNFHRLETSALIREVKQRPILWNNSHDRYFHKTNKRFAWIEVCEALSENFSQCDDAQQKATIQDVMSRWRTIRDNYVRKCKKNMQVQNSALKDGRRLKKYIFEDELSFLSEKYLDRRSSSCSNQSNLEPISQTESFFEEVEEAPSLSTSYLPVSPKREVESPVEEEKVPMEPKEEEQISEWDPFDEDLGYFLSLLPTVKQLTRLEKLDFRIKTMQLLQDQLTQRSSQSCQTRSNRGGLQQTEFSVCGREVNSQMYLPEND